MGTTALVAELLVVGIQALVWMAILAITPASDSELCALASTFLNLPAPVVGLLVAAAYTVGVVMDRLTDTLLSRVDRQIRRRVIRKKFFSVPRARLYVMQHGEKMSGFLEYVRSRLRIAREIG